MPVKRGRSVEIGVTMASTPDLVQQKVSDEGGSRLASVLFAMLRVRSHLFYNALFF